MAETLVAMEGRSGIDPQAVFRGGVSSDIKLPSLASFDQIQPTLRPATTETADPQTVLRGGVSPEIKLPSLASFDQAISTPSGSLGRSAAGTREIGPLYGAYKSGKEILIGASKKAAYAALGGVALLSLTAGSLFGVSKFTDDSTPVEVASATAAPFPETPQPQPTDVTEMPPVTEPPVQEVVPSIPEFEVQPGDLLGTIKVPALCDLEIKVYAFKDTEWEAVGGDSSTDATIDWLVPDPTPDTSCEAMDEREREREAESGQDHTTRPQGGAKHNPNLSSFQPIAGYMMSQDGGYLTSIPGSEGNVVIGGHGSTFSAPFADMALLRPGDTIEFERADGQTFTYELVHQDPEPGDTIEDHKRFAEYSHPSGAPTMVTYGCSDSNGMPGSSDQRYANYWVQTSQGVSVQVSQ